MPKINQPIRIAAIDIGSNAVRMKVSGLTVTGNGKHFLKTLEYIRFPFRLGTDVFETGAIRPATADKFSKLMQAFKLLIDLYETSTYMACATSAMREAENGKDLVASIKKSCGLDINIIDGQREAALIATSIAGSIEKSQNYLHIDVGGGSTELNIYHHGVIEHSASFPLGSVRNTINTHQNWLQIEDWLHDNLQKQHHPLTAVGTGGNIGKVFELYKQLYKNKKALSIGDVYEIYNLLRPLTVAERQEKYQLNPDRADVIVPATEIYLHVMNVAGVKKIIAPDAGLADGILLELFHKAAPNIDLTDEI